MESTGRLLAYIAVVTAAAWAVASLTVPLVDMGAKGTATGREAGVAASTLLEVVAVHGVRNSTSADVWDVKVTLTPSPGSAPLDLRDAVLRYHDATGRARFYAFASGALADGAAPSTTFHATWLQGGSSAPILQPGDVVQAHVNLVDGTLAPRTLAEVSIDPPVGVAADASFLAPAAYGDALVLALG